MFQINKKSILKKINYIFKKEEGKHIFQTLSFYFPKKKEIILLIEYLFIFYEFLGNFSDNFLNLNGNKTYLKSVHV